MKNVIRFSGSLVLLSVLTSCFSQPEAPNVPQVSPPPVAAARPASPQPVPVAPTPEQTVDATIQAILTSSSLSLQVNEELMLIGNLRLNNGQTVSFDELQNLLQLDNQTPTLLQLDAANRLVRALKAGQATVVISSRQNPNIKVPVTIDIVAPPPGIDPNVALVDLEIQ